MVIRCLIGMVSSAALAAPALASGLPQQSPSDHSAQRHYVPPMAGQVPNSAEADARLAIFAPTNDPIRHQIDYEIWDWALKNITVTMGPSNRQIARRADPILGTRVKQGPQSRYRLEGSMVLFRFLTPDVIASFGEYRRDLEQVTETLDIASLPRNEQLAFWLNLHNVAMLEQLSQAWPLREPREIKVGGVPLDEARFITVRGVVVSLRDIREQIVFRHWKDPKVMYGFWRGEIGGPELQRHAFTGGNVSSLLDLAAADFVNSLRGTQQRGDALEVASLYAEVAPFYFADFERDVRAHLARYAEEPVAGILEKTTVTRATIAEPAIADLHGGARPANFLYASSTPGAMDDPLVGWSDELGQGAFELLEARRSKLERMERRGQPTGRVFFSNIDLPTDPPNKNAVE